MRVFLIKIWMTSNLIFSCRVTLGAKVLITVFKMLRCYEYFFFGSFIFELTVLLKCFAEDVLIIILWLHMTNLNKFSIFILIFSFFVALCRIQDLCIIFAIIVVFLVFFNTYIFQAGLVSLLIRKFKTTIIISILYLALSVGLHVWTMVSVLQFFKICDCKLSHYTMLCDTI